MNRRDHGNNNPYAIPQSPTGLTASRGHRTVSVVVVAAVGAVLGVGAYFASLALIPSNVASPVEHDLLLANRIGFIYPSLIGLWGAWIRRSLPWAFIGVFSGLLIGVLYYALCEYNLNGVMVAFPCLLGGIASVLMGTKAGFWSAGVLQRFGKGLVAGFVLGIVYTIVLNLVGLITGLGFARFLADYISMIWNIGPVAMGVASALYLILFHWSAGLDETRVRAGPFLKTTNRKA